jgi:glycosyltransferase involved in cell wall biosynthesis
MSAGNERRPEAPTVAVIGPLPPPSHGHMVFTQRLLDSELLARRFRIAHVDISDHRELGTIGRLDPINIALALRDFWRLLRTLAGKRPAVVHVPMAQNLLGLGRDLVFIAITLLCRSSVVAQVHGGGLGTFMESAPAWFRALARPLLRRCAAFVVMTPWQAASTGAAVPTHRIVVIPHGTDENEAPLPQTRADSFRALYVSSHLHESKGLEPLVEAAIASQQAGVTTEWEIVGAWLDEETRLAIEQRTRRVEGITFRGAVDRAELPAVYSRADAFVFPTGPNEGFALVRIEAMAAGLPVITTEAGGGREIVDEGVEGFIVDYDAPDQIVERLRALREDPERRAAIGANARRRQREQFSTRAFEASLADLWDRAAARAR